MSVLKKIAKRMQDVPALGDLCHRGAARFTNRQHTAQARQHVLWNISEHVSKGDAFEIRPEHQPVGFATANNVGHLLTAKASVDGQDCRA